MSALREASMEPEQFWYAVSMEWCDDDIRFPKMSQLVLKLATVCWVSQENDQQEMDCNRKKENNDLPS